MALPIFFSDDHLDLDSLLVLDEETSKHIVQVLRMKKGEAIRLTNGKGKLAEAEIDDDHKKKTIVKINRVVSQDAPSKKNTIAISLLKNANRFEWFLEKATEIGVFCIIPLLCERTEKHHFRLERMKNILVSAMLQSQQVWLPELSEPLQFRSVIEQSMQQQKFIAHCVEDDKKDLHNRVNRSSESSIILIGPEGDFTNTEIEFAVGKGFVPVSLGETRLRSETAGMVAAAYLA